MTGTVRKATLVALLVVAAVGLSGCSYNRFVGQEEAIKAQWAQVENQLQRRNDLIPNLVSTVEGYATHEREVLTQVTAHRADAVQGGSVAATAQADMAMTGMLGRLMAVAEAYPQLKADANFRQLQDELTEVEDNLQSARRYYNATVRDLNTRIQSFPNVLVARPMGFSEEEFYTDTDASIQTAPVVKFGEAKA